MKLNIMKKIIISPPFSNIYRNENCTNIIGTYTAEKRKGLHRVITTLRPTKGGWYNNVGLRNPGIKNLHKKFKENDIVSVYIEGLNDYQYVFEVLSQLKVRDIELNVSCPNYKEPKIHNSIILYCLSNFRNVSLKVPHGVEYNFISKFYDSGISLFHISNSSKTPYGALSGKYLVYNNVQLIRRVKKELQNNVKIIGGGGIYNLEIANIYIDVGADFLSLSTALLKPFKIKDLISELHERF